MAITIRKGAEADLYKNRLVAGELAMTTDTKKLFCAFAAGDTKQLATNEDFQTQIDAIQDVVDEGTQMIEDFTSLAVTKCNVDDTQASSLTTYSSDKIETDYYNKTEVDQEIDSDVATAVTTVLGDIATSYSASSTYAVGDYCVKDNQLYKCSTAIATAETWNSEHWTSTTAGAEIKALNIGFTKSNIQNLAYEAISLDANGDLNNAPLGVSWTPITCSNLPANDYGMVVTYVFSHIKIQMWMALNLRVIYTRRYQNGWYAWGQI